MEIPRGKFAKTHLFSLRFSCHLGSNPVVCVLNADGLSLGRFVCSGGFFPGWVLEWKLLSGFPTMFSQQLEDRGCCPLSCKQKGQSTVPSRQNKHTLLLRGQPQAACARWWPGQQLSAFPVTALSFLQKPAPECISGLLSKAPFHEFIDYTQTAFWYQDASLKSQERDLMYANPL